MKSDDSFQINGAQIRAARALLRWSADDLAGHAQLGVATIRRSEAQDGVPAITAANLRAMRLALEDAGIEFSNDGYRFGVSRRAEPALG